ncbi:MAG: aminotransferase class V-fold PLP-dependent enzyme [Calditrichia bacterium]
MNWESYRTFFPHLQDQIYLNHAAIAPQNLRAQKAIEKYYQERISGDIEYWPAAWDLKQDFLAKVGKLINCPARQLALVSSTSHGLNLLALGIDWQPGDRILLNDFEFPSNVIPFLNLERKGVQIDFVHHRNGRLLVEDFEKMLSPRTRLLSISFVEFLNGYRNDLAALGELCRQNGTIFCVDAIQGLGALKMDVEKWQIDFLATAGHKWLMWPAGMGFVYISPRIFDMLHPAIAGWLSLKTPWDFFDYRQPFSETAQRFEPGGFSMINLAGAKATLEMMLEIGPENIERKVLQNTDFLIRELEQMGIELFTDPTPERRSGSVSFFHPRAEAIFEYLKSQRITVSLREGRIRVSPHFYNNQTDLEHFLEKLQLAVRD